MINHPIKTFTIGVTGSSAQDFFDCLKRANIKKLIDTRLWAGSQLAGFAKKRDLSYFTKALTAATYEYRVELAPSADILKAYKNNRMSWAEYEAAYTDLITHRNVARTLSPVDVDEACFLCACSTHDHCHRRVLVEYLQRTWDMPLEIVHL